MTASPVLRRPLVAVLAALVLVASACGLSRDVADDTAATITFDDGTQVDIASERIDEMYDPLVDDVDFVAGAYQGTVPETLRSAMLDNLIVNAILDRLLDENGATVSDDDRAEGTSQIEAAVAGVFPLEDDPVATAQARFDTLPYLPFLADLQAKQAALVDALVEAAPPGESVEVPCSRHILLETEEAALEVVGLLEDGGDFATLAMERSTGPSGPTGGDLGCTDPAGFVPEFGAAITDAPLDTIIGPVQTQFGWHVITVYGTEEQQRNAPDGVALLNNEVLSLLSQIDVDVDPFYGEWNGATGRVEATS